MNVRSRMASHARRPAATLIVGSLIAVVATISVSPSIHAHDGISSSDPASGSVLDQPIDVVTIDFGAEIGSDTELALLGPDDDELPSTTTVTSATTAQVEFEMLQNEGTYIVRYLAPSVTDGHLIVGAISFTYGSAGGASVVPWVLFAIASVAILGVGAWFSLRARSRQDEDDRNDIVTADHR